MLKNTTILLLLIFVFACNQKKNVETESLSGQQTETETQDSTTMSLGREVSEDNIEYYNSNRLDFGEFALILDESEVWSLGKVKGQEDTLYVSLEPGQPVDGRTVRIELLKKSTITIFQQIENSITIMDEGPHCDLTDWKHYYSDWEQLEIQNNEFVVNAYSSDAKKFIDVDMEELRLAVQKQCGQQWAYLIKNVKSPQEYPCGVSTSRIFLKIIVEDPETGTSLTRMVTFLVPMGC